MFHVGFTGTQEGYNSRGGQGRTMFDLLCYLRHKQGKLVGHHGDCIGADADFHRQCRALGIPRWIHPPTNDAKQAFAFKTDDARQTKHNTFEEPLPYLDRNQVIVDMSAILLACPKGFAEEQRSGTWSTVRYARRAKRLIVIVYPDGTWATENPNHGIIAI